MPPTVTSPANKRPKPRLSSEDRRRLYKPGSIVRVRLHNFLTYADVEFFPGPRLNVVVGPNGTGKSTILCAICLGLGGQPPLLGRADDARTFIMHEKSRARIEIELAPFADRNEEDGSAADVVTRIIDRDKGSERGRGRGASTYYINGVQCSAASVVELVSETYHIAIDNLCTFLPQDRVGSFSGFTPIDLLVETERAVGRDTLEKPHLELQALESEIQNEGTTVETVADRLRALEEENKQLERERELMEERKTAIRRRKLLLQKKLWLDFDRAREEAVEGKVKRDEAKKKLEEARVGLEPLQERISAMEADVQRIAARSKSNQNSYRAALNDFENAARKGDTYQDRVDEEVANLTDVDAQQRRAEKLVEKNRARVKELEELESSKTNFPNSLEEVDEQLRIATAELREKKRRVDSAKRELQATDNAYREVEETANHLQNKLERMQDEKARRRQALFRQHQNLGKIYEWNEHNRKMFRRPVWGPIACEVSLKSADHAAYLEQHCSNAVLKSFVVECREDYNLLYRELREKLKLPINIHTVPNGRLEPVRRMYSDDKFHTLQKDHGVQCYLDETFEAPDAVRQALVAASSVHAVLVGGDETQHSLDNRGLLDFLGQREDGRPGAMASCIFSTQRQSSTTSHSKYTSVVSRFSGKCSVRIDEVVSARMLAAGADPMAKERLEQELKEVHQRLAQELAPRREQAQQAYDDAMKDAQACNQQKEALRMQKSKIENHQMKLRTARQRLEDSIESANKDFAVEKRRVVGRIRKFVEMSVHELEVLGACQEKMMEATRAVAGVKMTEDGFNASMQRYIDLLSEKKEETAHLEKFVKDHVIAFNNAKKKMKDLKNLADSKAPMIDADGNDLPLKAELEQLPETLEEVEAEIEETNKIIENITENPEVLRLYQLRKREIEETKEELSNLEHSHGVKDSKLKTLLQEWKSRLQNTVTRVNELFSGYMADLGCAGEVRLSYGGSPNEDSNFDRWGVEIRVKFREKSSLQVLSAQVQSGGERSVSTIMYLMALQELMVSPFRCVDEINQGLDERNERLVFRRIVSNSTGPSGSHHRNHSNGGSASRVQEHNGQYFLITPKLLPNLTDMENEDVTILFIFNGPYNFDHYLDWNVDKMLGLHETLPQSVKRKRNAVKTEEDEEVEEE